MEKIEQVILTGGSRWKATEDIYGWDLEFKQDKGQLLFDKFYVPVSLVDLGPGEITDFVTKTKIQQAWRDPEEVDVQSGHVYLLNQEHWGRWVLFKLEIIE